MINRKILASFLVIAVVGAVAGSGTLAYFNDTEESTGNTFTAGAVDLKIDWTESYNGETVQLSGYEDNGDFDPGTDDQQLVDNPGPVFNFSDVKPGDEGEATLSFHIDNNPSWLWMSTDMPVNAENGCTEPEGEVDESCSDSDTSDGELAEHINVRLWYDDEDDGATPGDNEYQESETVIIGGGEQQCEPGDSGRADLDVALTLDRSGSMDDSDGRFGAMQTGSKDLVDTLSDTNDQSAAVSFANGASVDQPLTTDHEDVKTAIENLQTGGSTEMDLGIDAARQELNDNGRSGANQVMVVFGDGEPDSNSDTISAAQAAKDDEIRVITIAYGDNADQSLMENLATSSDDAYYAPDTQALNDVFEDIEESVGECEEGPATLADLHDQMEDGQLLDGDTETSGDQAFSGSQTQYIGFEWWIPEETGNVIQTDSVEFDMNFYAEQERNNDDPANPFPLGSG